MSQTIIVRRDTSANWIAAGNPVLAAGELGYDTDLKLTKMGDGVTAWNLLPSISAGSEPDLSSYVTSTALSTLLDGYVAESDTISSANVVGRTDGLAPTTGRIGEVLEWINLDPGGIHAGLNTWTLLGTGRLIPAGNWLIGVGGFINGTTGITKGFIGWGLGSSPDPDKLGPLFRCDASSIITGLAPSRKVNLSTPTYVKVWIMRGDSTYGDYAFYSLTAVRIA